MNLETTAKVLAAEAQKISGWRYPTAFSLWDEKEYDAIQRVWKSERWTMGAEVEAFEKEFARFHARRHGIMVNSGSSANLIAVASLYEKEGRPLQRIHPNWSPPPREGAVPGLSWPMPEDAIVPAIAWSTTYAPLIQHGLDLVVVDVDDTWNAPVPQWIPRTKTRILVCASILGNPGYLREWRDKADALGYYLIEDNCESLGAFPYDGGPPCGAFGHLSTFSFFYSHQISAIEGGMILTDDDELAMLCRRLRAHGWTRNDPEPPVGFESEYDFRHFGYNVRPLEMHAAVAREQLKKLPAMREERRKNWVHFVDACRDLPVRLPAPVPRAVLSPFGLPFCVESQGYRSILARKLRERGIDCRLPTGGSFLRHAYGAPWRRYKNGEEKSYTPEADRIHATGMFFGNAPWDIRELIDEAVDIMRETLT